MPKDGWKNTNWEGTLPMDKLSSKEKSCILFLSNKMEATAGMVGVAIANRLVSWPTRLGAGVLGSLHKKGYVMRLPELKAWRLTRKGREYVNKR